MNTINDQKTNKENLLNYFNQDEMAAVVWKDKYAAPGEQIPDEMHYRVANEFFRAEEFLKRKFNKSVNKELLSEYGKSRKENTLDSIYQYFKNFKHIVPQGRVLSGLGVKGSYRSLSNCLRLPPPKDSYSSIMYSDTMLVSAAKRGCGYGLGISNLRPETTVVRNSSNSSTGAISFMSRFSNSTREVAQAGRRGACLIDIDIKHPDSLSFINSKIDRTKITGANISVKLSDDFMKAVEKDEDFILSWPCDLNHTLDSGFIPEKVKHNVLIKGALGYYRKIKAKEYFENIVSNAWENAEPGVFFWDRVQNYDPCSVYPQFKIDGTNACIAKGTLVLTPFGYKKVEDIKVGDQISTSFGTEPVKTIETHKNYEVIKVNLSDGSSIDVTQNHIFYGKNKGSISKINKELRAKNLKIGDYIRVQKIFNTLEENFDNYDYFLKKGILLGDGCYTNTQLKNTNCIKIASNVDDKEYNEKLINKFNIVQKPNKDKNSKSVAYAIANGKNIVKDLNLNSYSTIDEKTFDIHECKSIGDFIGILDGLLATDGNINKTSNHPQVRWFTSSKLMAENIRLALLAIGCQSRITFTNDEGGSINGRKIKRNFPKNTITISGESISNYIKFSKLSELHPVKGEALYNLLKEYSLTGGTWYANVLSIEKANNIDVFDLYCEKSDTWVANGYLHRGCGEQPMCVYDTCRLILLNLYSFVKDPFEGKANIDYNLLYSMAYEQAYLGDTLVELEIEYIDKIITKIYSDPEPIKEKQIELDLWINVKKIAQEGRRVGCGITGLGDMLAALNLKYDSAEALKEVEKVMHTKMKAELDCAIDLAITREPFHNWDPMKEEFISNDWYKAVKEEFPEQYKKMLKYGRRFVNFSTIAPAGTISLMTQTTSGCEPLFQPYYTRRKKINPSEEGVKIDFVDQNGDSWTEFPVLHHKFKEWLKISTLYTEESLKEISKEELELLFKGSPWYKCTANDINWEKRVAMQAILQRYTTSAISTTLNLPENVTREEVYKIYMNSWKMGLKGQTIYRDNCRTGVLINNNTASSQEDFKQIDAPKRPKNLKCDIYTVVSKGIKWNILIGMFKDRPYEIFASPHFTNEKVGYLEKIKKGYYNVLDIQNNLLRENITDFNSEEEENITRLVSMSLRHGANVSFVSEQLNKTSGIVTSFSKAIARTLKNYIVIGTKSTVACENCGESTIIFTENCQMCTTCGNSKC